jgi:pyruvate/2-oxoglutarate dehydrogenase complex dihydrolipoamide dehydrogenase (E3) component
VDGGTERHTFDKLILATGSLPISIPGWPMDNTRMLDDLSIELQYPTLEAGLAAMKDGEE